MPYGDPAMILQSPHDFCILILGQKSYDNNTHRHCMPFDFLLWFSLKFSDKIATRSYGNRMVAAHFKWRSYGARAMSRYGVPMNAD